MDDTTIADTADEAIDTVAAAADRDAADETVDEELLIEEVSIDGMCGVY